MDRTGVFLRVGVYVLLYGLAVVLSAKLLVWLAGYFVGVILSQFLSAIATNWVTLRIHTGLRLSNLGLKWNAAAVRNLGVGMAGGMGAAALALAPPLATGAARLAPAAGPPVGWEAVLFTIAILFLGSAGEEILFHGYGFQLLLGVWGPYTTIFTVGAIFAAMHGGNPNATWLALLNTAGFGILFGYAFLRSCDLWLPIGLHFGWNFTLPLFGVNVSGLTMKLTSHEMEWNVSSLWSGGEYGPEGSILTTIVLAALATFVWRAPVRKQQSEVFPCVPGSPFSY
jgi:membrane protease YdiL (CAAX protease family)